jgi:hypothetical protein
MSQSSIFRTVSSGILFVALAWTHRALSQDQPDKPFKVFQFPANTDSADRWGRIGLGDGARQLYDRNGSAA